MLKDYHPWGVGGGGAPRVNLLLLLKIALPFMVSQCSILILEMSKLVVKESAMFQLLIKRVWFTTLLGNQGVGLLGGVNLELPLLL